MSLTLFSTGLYEMQLLWMEIKKHLHDGTFRSPATDLSLDCFLTQS